MYEKVDRFIIFAYSIGGRMDLKNKFFFLIILALLKINPLFSQEETHILKKLTTREGLSQNDANSIYQDENGFIWIGTNDGLNRYDGYQFKLYKYEEDGAQQSLPSRLIHRVSGNKNGKIAIATTDKGLHIIDLKKDELSVISSGISDETIRAMNFSTKDSLWVSTLNQLYLYTLGDSITGGKISSPEKIGLTSFEGIEQTFDKDKNMWFACMDGVYKLSYPYTKKATRVIDRSTRPGQISLNDSILATTYGRRLIVANLNDPNTFITTKMLRATSDLLVDRENNIWTAHRNGITQYKIDTTGLLIENTQLVQGNNAQNLNSNNIACMYEDNIGQVWIGTFSGGPNIYNPNRKKFTNLTNLFPENLKTSKVSCILETFEGDVLVGTRGTGIAVLNREQGRLKVNEEKSKWYDSIHPLIHSMAQITMPNGTHALLIGSHGGTWLIQGSKKTKLPEMGQLPFDIVQDKNLVVWIATHGKGLVRWDPKEELPFRLFNERNSKLSTSILRSLLIDSNGNLLIGTKKGILRIDQTELDKRTPLVTSIKSSSNDYRALSNDYILPLYETRKKDIYVGTFGGGLDKLIQTGTGEFEFQHISSKQGLANNVIKGILDDEDGNLWVSTNRGISFIRTDSLYIRNYGIQDGLQDYEFSELAYCKLSDGRLSFGGVNGINVFHPKDIIEVETDATIAITDLRILNENIATGQKVNGRTLLSSAIEYTNLLKLKHKENSFSVAFTPLHLAAPLNNKAKYRLLGFEEQWTETTGTSGLAKYTNIPAGSYALQFQAANSDGVWNPNIKTLKIKILRPFYASNLMLILYVIVLFVIVSLFIQYRLVRDRQKRELEFEKFEKKKMEEISNIKLRFFTNISHELRTPVTLIISPLEELIRKGENINIKNMQKSLAVMHQSASSLLRLVNQLLDFRKFEQGKLKLGIRKGNLVEFMDNIYSAFLPQAEKNQISLNIYPNVYEHNVWFDADKLEKVMNNLISNALKYTESGGKVSIEVIQEEISTTNYRISVSDNGLGIPESKKEHIFERFYQASQIKDTKSGSTGIGLSFSKSLVELMNGTLNFTSKEGKGTIFTIQLPVNRESFSDDELLLDDGWDIASPVVYSEDKETKNTDNADTTSDNRPSILVVEDNVDLRSYIKDELSTKYNVHTAENGELGLRLALETIPDLVISDLMMPKLNGFELSTQLRSKEETKHIPIIILTAKSNTEDQIQGFDIGIDAYVTKPFNMELLNTRINTIIERKEKLRLHYKQNFILSPSKAEPKNSDEKFLTEVLNFIEEKIADNDYSIPELAKDVGLTQYIFTKKILNLTGLRPKALIRSIKLKRGAQLLEFGELNINQVSYEIGYSDPKQFRMYFKEQFKMTPSEYQKKHKSSKKNVE